MSIQQQLQHLWICGQAAIWAAMGGGITTLADAIDDATSYEGPIDLPHIKRLFITGALVGLAGWWRSRVALGTPVPTPKTPTEGGK